VLASARKIRSPVLLILANLIPRVPRSTWPSVEGVGARCATTLGTGECKVTAPWSTTGDKLGSCATSGSGSTLSVASVSVTATGLPTRWVNGGGSPRVCLRDDPPLGRGDYWIAATAALTLDCKALGSGAYPRSSSLLCDSEEEKYVRKSLTIAVLSAARPLLQAIS
jgi:hypothetical protein